MENNTIENPWNMTLKTLDENEYDGNCKISQSRSFIDRFYFIRSTPYLFSKSNNLVLCEKCNILICKSSFLRHARIRHHNPEEGSPPFEITDIKTVFSAPNVHKKVPKKSIKISSRSQSQISFKDKEDKVKVNKNVKVSKKIESPIERDYSNLRSLNNFVPKSTLNAANPLRIKIQLQPKRDNVFEYINDYSNYITKSQSEPIQSNLRNHRNENTEYVNLTSRAAYRQPNILPSTPHKYRRGSHVDNYDRPRPMSNGSRPPCGAPIISHTMPHRARHANQTPKLLNNQDRSESSLLSQRPQVFQTFRREINSVRTSQKKYVEVKSLRETLIPVTSTQSLNSSDNNLDTNQRSFQQILIDNGVFSQEDIKRCQKPTPGLDIGLVNKAKRSSNFSGPGSMVRLVQGVAVTPRSTTESYPKYLNHHTIRPYSLGRPNDIMTNSDPILTSKAVQSNVRSHNGNFYQNLDLSDDDFFLDTALTNNIDPRTIAQISDNVDAEVHYLPPPEETITSLSWEI